MALTAEVADVVVVDTVTEAAERQATARHPERKGREGKVFDLGWDAGDEHHGVSLAEVPHRTRKEESQEWQGTPHILCVRACVRACSRACLPARARARPPACVRAHACVCGMHA